MPVKDIVKSILRIVVTAYFASAILLFLFQRSFLYHPVAEYQHGMQIKQVVNEGERLSVITANTDKRHAIIYFGGNAEAVVFSVNSFVKLLPDHALYFVNYRGYGGSTGTPTERGLYSDSLAVYDAIAGSYDSVSVIGRSLGSGVATYLAAKREIKAAVLVTPYDSIERVAAGHFPFFPTSILLKDKYESIKRVKFVKAPVLIIRAELDEVIPARHSIALFEAFQDGQAAMQAIQNVSHNSVSDSREYFAYIREFFLPSESRTGL